MSQKDAILFILFILGIRIQAKLDIILRFCFKWTHGFDRAMFSNSELSRFLPLLIISKVQESFAIVVYLMAIPLVPRKTETVIRVEAL